MNLLSPAVPAVSFLNLSKMNSKLVKLIVCKGLKGCYSKQNPITYSLISLSVSYCVPVSFSKKERMNPAIGLEAVISNINEFHKLTKEKLESESFQRGLYYSQSLIHGTLKLG